MENVVRNVRQPESCYLVLIHFNLRNVKILVYTPFQVDKKVKFIMRNNKFIMGIERAY